jgi:hypothetical protein
VGSADTILRIALKSYLQQPLSNCDKVDKAFVSSFIDLMICECLAIGAARAMHMVPSQLCIWSLVVKCYLPDAVEKLTERLSRAANSYVQKDDHKLFLKFVRDNAVISMFEGSKINHLKYLKSQLKYFGRRKITNDSRDPEKMCRIRLKKIFDLTEGLPALNYEQLCLLNQGDHDIFYGVNVMMNDLTVLKMNNAGLIIEEIHRYIHVISNEFERLEGLFHNQTADADQYNDLSWVKDYCLLHTSLCCMFLWWFNREELGTFFGEGEWLVLALRKMLLKFDHLHQEYTEEYDENIFTYLVSMFNDKKLFSIVPLKVEC